ncbi:MAG: Lrp/AsnC family transcriptional regulator [Desulfobacteraceae bacterium]|nr:MAG: Lrp/AsnC family transcriptional regulator [Desulfobacteraceae bacterium]
MDNTDKALLNRIQSNFPVSHRPFLDIASEFDLSEDETILRIQRLKASGVIRRIGGNFVPGKLGYVSTLCAAKVPENTIDEFAKVVNSYPGVTHNYVRENDYNVWFTFIAPSMALIRQYLEEISIKTGICDILNLPATRVFKIKAHFKL